MLGKADVAPMRHSYLRHKKHAQNSDCYGKTSFASASLAMRVARRDKKSKGAMDVYHCGRCGGYHIGHKHQRSWQKRGGGMTRHLTHEQAVEAIALQARAIARALAADKVDLSDVLAQPVDLRRLQVSGKNGMLLFACGSCVRQALIVGPRLKRAATREALSTALLGISATMLALIDPAETHNLYYAKDAS